MKDFAGKVAVVTGAASGIGRAMARRFAAEGMKVVLADIEQDALALTAAEMQTAGAAVLAVRTDVSDGESVADLARKTVDAFGAVHIVCNNAGVGTPVGPIWERTEADWKWVLGVNLWGVIHGIRVFVPLMLKQKTECHVVNTASLAGLISAPGLGIYHASKHAVVTISEVLFQELSMGGALIGVSVLCPAFVQTRIHESHRNRPRELSEGPASDGPSAERIRQLVERGIPVETVAERVIEAVRGGKLYILTHPEHAERVKTRVMNIIEGRNPEPVIIGGR